MDMPWVVGDEDDEARIRLYYSPFQLVSPSAREQCSDP